MGDVLRAHRGHRRASWLISGVFAAFGALTCMASPSAAFDGSGGAIDLAHSSETVAHSNPDALAAQHVDVRGVADELEAEAIVAQLGVWLEDALAASREQGELAIWNVAVRDADYGYSANVRVELERSVQEEEVQCSPCGVTELVAAVDSAAERVIGLARESARESATVPSAPPGELEGGDSETSGDGPGAKGTRPMKILGISSLSLGSAAVIAGAVLWTRPDAAAVDDGEVVRRSTRPAGAATLGTGIGLIGVGAVLLILDGLERRRPEGARDTRRPTSQRPRVVVMPTRVSATASGLAAVGSF